MKHLLLYFAVFISFVSPSVAQESSGLGGYVPPPLFGAPQATPPQRPKSQEERSLGLPEISEEVLPVKDEIKPLPAIVEKESDKPILPEVNHEAPKPQEKPAVIKKPETAKEKSAVKAEPEPIDVLRKEEIPPPPPFEEGDRPAFKPIMKSTSEGVVKGPKTMPSNKKNSVETEITFDQESPEPVEIFERVQNLQEKQPEPQPQLEVQESKEIDQASLPKLEKQSDGTQKLTLYFEGNNNFKSEHEVTLMKVVIPALQKQDNSKINIESYASSTEEGLNSARRISLDRALSVREILLNGGIEPNRINVRAMGSETNSQPLDRAELSLTAP